MNETFLKLYEEELGHIRDLSADFGNQYPKIAGRLGLSREECDDPFVERMIEGFAFLAARVRTKLDAEYSNFSESLLESVYPQLLGPVPSMTIVEFKPDDKLAGSFVLPRGSTMTSHLGADEDSRCEFRTAHEIVLQPLRISHTEKAKYYLRDVDALRLPASSNAKAAIKVRFEHSQAGKTISSLEDFEALSLHLAGNMDAAGAIYEELFAHCTHVYLRPVMSGMTIPSGKLLPVNDGQLKLTPVGFSAAESLLPADARSFDGYRLLREYAILPQRFMFLKLHGQGLKEFTAQCDQAGFDLIFLLDRTREELSRYVDGQRFKLHATPAINLFQRRADQIQLSERFDRAHVVIDKTRPLAYEVYQVLSVNGTGDQLSTRRKFEPFYRNSNDQAASRNFYTVHREKRNLTHREARFGSHFDYTGSEVYLYLVDAAQTLQQSEISALSVTALCTNRHLALTIPINQHATDFFVDAGIPASGVKCLIAPTRPVHSPAEGAMAWRLISQLSLNYLSLVDNDQGAAALRGILELYTEHTPEDSSYWTKALIGIKSRPIVRRHLAAGPVSFIRGLEVTILMDESRLAGHSAYTLGAMLAHFLARYVSINSFVETVVETTRRGDLGRWPGRPGSQHIL
ncbi:MAG: type VI secretion system baseplate subunit TssF [Verrucomicrobia bacterium]|nr:type VI secretion system baseplate subunit TssF [Verrucomicrobiota bacterium]